MGHCDSPARHSGADRIFSADGRTPQPAAERALLISDQPENRPGITARFLLVILRVYQTYLSSMNFSSCRFYPSCSHYAGEAVERFGARRGVWLALKRLARCQPFSRAGFDPVPDHISNAPIYSHSSNVRATRGQELAQ
jgi:putative membrane protein insertion efficiency factor